MFFFLWYKNKQNNVVLHKWIIDGTNVKVKILQLMQQDSFENYLREEVLVFLRILGLSPGEKQTKVLSPSSK